MLHEVARAGGEQLVDDGAGSVPHVLLELADHLRGERARDDPAEPGVPRVVHVDHRTEVLVELHRQVFDARRTRGRREQLRAPAGLGHVGVPQQRVVAAFLDAERGIGRFEERRRLKRPQRPVSGMTLSVRQRPEGVVRKVEVAAPRLLVSHRMLTFRRTVPPSTYSIGAGVHRPRSKRRQAAHRSQAAAEGRRVGGIWHQDRAAQAAIKNGSARCVSSRLIPGCPAASVRPAVRRPRSIVMTPLRSPAERMVTGGLCRP